jgi:SAM-dependent methyltransferase
MTVCTACGAVQKIPDAAWFDEIDRIYGAYQIYELASGSEQVIFAGDGGGMPRSQRLADFIKSSAALPDQGKLIDIGCGNGGALQTFSRVLPNWQLYGTELTDAAQSRLERLPNFVRLFTGKQPEIYERFDLVCMIHSLEHMPAPLTTLKQAAELLAADGRLLVEIPDIETSPFDLIVADHLLHFTRATLRYAAERAGFSAQVIRNDLLPKENTLLAALEPVDPARPDPARGIALVKRNVKWLDALITVANKAASTEAPFGLFGTSISGTWIYGALKDKVRFFVDEDDSKIGKTIDGRPIVKPENVGPGAVVYVPLIPDVAAKVIARLSGAAATFLAPPPLAA